MNKLQGKFMLDNVVKIYVPSTNNVSKKVNNKKQVTKTLVFLSKTFGGATEQNGIGGYIATSENLVLEKVNICYSYTTAEGLQEHQNNLVDYCENLKIEMSQESIALEINGKLYFI